MNKHFLNKGFTLIELLVVISIIGLLSSVVLASLSVARDKGRIAAGQQFAGSVDRATNLGPMAFDFNAVNGSTVKNFTGSFDGTLTAGVGLDSGDSPASGMGSSLEFTANPSSVYINFLSATNPDYAVTSKGFMLSAWIKPTAVSGVQNILSLGGDHILALSDSSVSFTIRRVELPIQVATVSTGGVSAGKWHHIAGKVEQSGVNILTSVYIDGKLVGTQTIANSTLYSLNSTGFCIGKDMTGNVCVSTGAGQFLGNIDNPRYINYSLTP